MYITHDHIDEIKCIVCGDLLPYYELNADHICGNCQQDNS